MEAYKKIRNELNSFNRSSWEKSIMEVFGNKVLHFSCYVIAQYARMNGQRYKDYNHETNGWRNPENCCSIMADKRNDQAIRKCSVLMEEKGFAEYSKKLMEKEGLKLMGYHDLWNPKTNEHPVTSVVRLCITDMHRTLQQSLVRACLEILKAHGKIPSEYNTYLFMV